MARSIDLNCDIGESFGAYSLGDDAEILKYVSSASIACGFHAGDPASMRKTIQLALERNVAIGAHPGLPDLVGFGRRAMQVSPQEVCAMVLYQVGALAAIARAEGATLKHVKPHGALYNMAAKDAGIARAIAQAVRTFDPACILLGLSGSELIRAGREAGLATASEAFADRTYQSDGSLTPRHLPGALVTDPAQASQRAVSMAQNGKVETLQGDSIPLEIDTICIHGDAPGAASLARLLREKLTLAGFEIRACQAQSR